jgi:hypothetical protein
MVGVCPVSSLTGNYISYNYPLLSSAQDTWANYLFSQRPCSIGYKLYASYLLSRIPGLTVLSFERPGIAGYKL